MKILIIGAAGMIGMRLAKSITKDAFMGRINEIGRASCRERV